jgi:hypothetical protein
LIKQDDVIAVWIEKGTVKRKGPHSGPSMEKKDRFSFRIAAFFPVEAMTSIHCEKSCSIRFDFGI